MCIYLPLDTNDNCQNMEEYCKCDRCMRHEINRKCTIVYLVQTKDIFGLIKCN